MSATERARSARSERNSAAGPHNWEEVNQALACLGELDRQVRALRDQLQQKVAVLKQQWLEASLPLERERRRLQDQMERFYWAHRNEVLAAGRKSAELAFGRIGSRRSRGVVVEDTVAAMRWLAANRLGQYLRTRTEVDREALRSTLLADDGTQEAAALLACPGIRLSETEEFWYEVYQPDGHMPLLPANRVEASKWSRKRLRNIAGAASLHRAGPVGRSNGETRGGTHDPASDAIL